MKDFFVSYNRADQQWAEWIAWTLEEAGYSVVIQAWDFRPGGNFVLDMQRAAAESQKTIAVLSETYLKSSYTQPEWAAAFAQDPESLERKLIPVRVKECKPQGMLSPIVYIDLVGRAETEAKKMLLDALKPRKKPLQQPPFPETKDSEDLTPLVPVFTKPQKFPGAMSRINQVKEKSLQQRIDSLIEDYEAISKQINFTTNEADRNRLERQQIAIAEDMDKAAKELDDLSSTDSPSQPRGNGKLGSNSQPEVPGIAAAQYPNLPETSLFYLTLKIDKSDNIIDDESRYQLEGWLAQSRDNEWDYQYLDINEEIKQENYSKIELKPILGYLINKSREIIGNNGDLAIECFAPRELLSIDFECWKYDFDDDDDEGSQLKNSFPIHIRCISRLEPKYGGDLKVKWQNKWDTIQNPNNFKNLDRNFERDSIKNPEWYLRQTNTFWDNCCTATPQELHKRLRAILKYGIPVAIWSRCHQQTQQHREDIKGLVTACNGNVQDLPEQIRERRIAALDEDAEDLGHHLSLLWEDPYRLPPLAPPF